VDPESVGDPVVVVVVVSAGISPPEASGGSCVVEVASDEVASDEVDAPSVVTLRPLHPAKTKAAAMTIPRVRTTTGAG
jgi:hypothetical protein